MVTDAKIKLQKLSMTGSYSRYPEFLSEFYTLAEAAEVSAEFRVHLLRSKVTQSLREGTRGNLSPPAADDFEGWANVYSTIWSNMETEKQIYSQNQSHNQPVRPKPQINFPPVHPSDQMNLDAIRLRTQLTPLEKKYRDDNNLCNYCGGSDHYRRNFNPERAKRSNSSFDSVDKEFRDNQAKSRGRTHPGQNLKLRSQDCPPGFLYDDTNSGSDFVAPAAGTHIQENSQLQH
ncbi:hypothetical protein K3495_g14557 [Podosphaera aphanis]|nr:hypothetical protein K3495_g14557 [Podosphaera aphanis]